MKHYKFSVVIRDILNSVILLSGVWHCVIRLNVAAPRLRNAAVSYILVVLK